MLSGSLAGPASAGNMGCRVGRDGSREGLSQPPAHGISVSVSCGCAPGCQLPTARCGQQCTGVKRNGSCCHPAPDVIQPWDNLPRSFSSLHGLVLLVPNPCRACEAQWNVAVWIQTCLDSKHSQQFLKLGGALLVGGSWVINPPLFPCLNSSSVPQKPHFKHWGRMVPVRAVPRSVLGFTDAYIFQLSHTFWKHIYCLFLLRTYKMICCLQR